MKLLPAILFILLAAISTLYVLERRKSRRLQNVVAFSGTSLGLMGTMHELGMHDHIGVKLADTRQKLLLFAQKERLDVPLVRVWVTSCTDYIDSGWVPEDRATAMKAYLEMIVQKSERGGIATE